MDLQAITQQTLQEATAALLKLQQEGKLQKALAVATGLTGYILEAPAKQLVPLMSPWRQSVPRTTKAGSNAVNWKAITAISQPKASTTESAAANEFTTTVADRSGTYKVVGLRGKVTREAEAASQGFDPALAKETTNTLLNAMKAEEMQMLGGNITALATPGAPTVAESDGKGSLAADEYFVRVAALTLPAANRVVIQRPADVDGDGDCLLAGVQVDSVDPATDGVTVVSDEASVTTVGGSDGLKVTWTAVPGAAAYAIFVGLTTGAANLTCEAIVTQTSVTFSSLATGGLAGDQLTGTSADAAAYNGLIQQLLASGSGAYVKVLNNILSGASNGEITEIQDMFQSIWDQAKIHKFRLLTGGQESRIVTRKSITAGGGPTIQVSPAPDGRVMMTQGYHVGQIVNAVTGHACPVETLPWIPGGMILAVPTEIPYNDANVSAPIDMIMGYDWERWDYASTSSTGPIWEFDTRCWGVLRVLVPAGCGIIYDIHKG